MRQPSLMAATAALSVTALFFSLGGAGLAANGGAFLLGAINSATQRTLLGASFNGSALQVSNTSAAALAVPLQLTAAAGHPPMKVNTVTKVANLNADYVDGIDASTQLTRVTRIPFNLAPGADSAAINLPANAPVLALAAVLGSPSHPGTGDSDWVSQVTLINDPNHGLYWIGFEYWKQLISNVSATPGDHIMYIDRHSQVDIRVVSTNAIRIHNQGGETLGGTLTLMW